MSQNYKIIREFKELVENIMEQGVSKTQIIEESGVAFARINEILNYDPVSVKIQDKTIEKLQVFIDEHKKKETHEREIVTLNKDCLLSELSALINDFQVIGYKLDVNISLIYKPVD